MQLDQAEAALRNAIVASDDWQARALGNEPQVAASSIVPLSARLQRKRLRVLLRYIVRPEDSVPREMAGVFDEGEAQWLRDFADFVSDPIRARSAEPFDATLLFGRPDPGFTGTSGRWSPPLPWEDRQAERQARACVGRWLGPQDANIWRRLVPGALLRWPEVPRAWKSLEVPFRLWAGTPLAVRAHGLLMAQHPFNGLAGNAPMAAVAHAAWCASLSQAAQLAAAALVDECIQHGRLFWINPSLCAVLRTMGPARVLGVSPGRGEILERLLVSVGSIRWDMVDPIGTTVPNHVHHGTPVFVGGDAVSWNPRAGPYGSLDVVPQLLLLPGESSTRGQSLRGNLVAQGRREPDEGNGLRLILWRGIPVDEMRQREPSPWEELAARKYREFQNRQSGWSIRGLRRRFRGRYRSRRNCGPR